MKVKIKDNTWKWHHNISECYYHIQLTIKYRRKVLTKEVEQTIVETAQGLNERYNIEISHIGFDQDHIHLMTRFLPVYSGGQVIKIIKSKTAKQVFKQHPDIKKVLWGGELWTDGYYIATISARGSKQTIINYIKKQGRKEDVKQLKLFNLAE